MKKIVKLISYEGQQWIKNEICIQGPRFCLFLVQLALLALSQRHSLEYTWYQWEAIQDQMLQKNNAEL